MKKKGSHVEMVISFVIFVGFLLFFYIIIEPAINKPKDKEYLLDSLEVNLVKYLSDEVRSYDLDITLDETGCSEDSIITCFEISPSPNKGNLFVKSESYNGEYQNYYSKNLSIWCKDCEENKYKLFFSNNFSQQGGGSECISHQLIANCYSLKPGTSEEHIFESRIEELKFLYESIGSENEIRNSLNIPSDNWFWFELTNNEGNEIIKPKEPNIPEDINVYSREIPITYIDESQDPENKKEGFLLIQIW